MALVEYLITVQIPVKDRPGKVQVTTGRVCGRHAEIAREGFKGSSFDGILWEIKRLPLVDMTDECPMCAKEKVLGIPYGT